MIRDLCRFIGLVFLVFLVSFVLQLPQQAAAQLFGAGQSAQKTSTQFIPKSAAAAAVIFPKRIAEEFDDFPREIVTAFGKKELGFDPMLINQATFLVQRFDTLDRPPGWAVILHFEEMQGLAGGIIDNLEQKEVGGKQIFSGTAMGMPSFLIYDEATIFVGDEAFFPALVAANKLGRIPELIKGRNVDGQLQGFIDVESIRPVLNQMLAELPGMLPPAVTRLKTIPNMVNAIELGVTVDLRMKTKLVIHADDEQTADDARKVLKNAIEFGIEMGIGALASQMNFDDPVQEATIEYAQRAGEEIKAQLMPQVNGKQLTLNLTEEVAAVPILIGMLLPAVQSVRHSARETQSMNNTRQMILGGLNYESVHGHFPAQASVDKDGKPLLSWRVHILPFVDQNELYEQFHLDEAWDSPHNRKLIRKMPQVYQSPSLGDLNGKTVYLGAAGEGLMFDGSNKRGFAMITDGSSNTVFMVEADASHAVEWTKPSDYQFDPKRPLDGVGNVIPGGFIVSFADGSARVISNNIDAEVWKNLLTIDGGEVIDHDQIDRR